MAVAREGITVSGSRRLWYARSRSSLETTMSPGLLSSSTSPSAKPSPTQLYSARLEVFSNGNTITTSADAFCGSDGWVATERFCAAVLVAGDSSAKNRKSAVNSRKLKATKLLKRDSEEPL